MLSTGAAFFVWSCTSLFYRSQLKWTGFEWNGSVYFKFNPPQTDYNFSFLTFLGRHLNYFSIIQWIFVSLKYTVIIFFSMVHKWSCTFIYVVGFGCGKVAMRRSGWPAWRSFGWEEGRTGGRGQPESRNNRRGLPPLFRLYSGQLPQRGPGKVRSRECKINRGNLKFSYKRGSSGQKNAAMAP